jgi:hypothetical protein
VIARSTVANKEYKQIELRTLADSTYGGIVSVSSVSPDWLPLAMKALAPGGHICLHVPADVNASRALLYAGATDTDTIDIPTSTTLKEVYGRRPPWNGAAAVPLALKRKTPVATPATGE